MFEKFGEFDSAEEINRAVMAQYEQGDMEAIKTICEENGLDYEMVEWIEEDGKICSVMDAAWGKISIEEKELDITKQELMQDWVDALKHMCVDYPEIAMGVRRKGKRLEECIVKILQYSFKNQVAIPQTLVEKALPNFHQKVSLGVPCMKQVKQIIRDYYMGE